MQYFSPKLMTPLVDKQDVDLLTPDELDALNKSLCQLHEHIILAFRQNNIALHTWHDLSCAPRLSTSATLDPVRSVTLSYTRNKTQAVIVERLLGREEIAASHTVEHHRHPSIELRLTPDHFTIEFIMSPDAWVDQQNLVGKLSLGRHRQEINRLLKNFNLGYCMGFWEGEHLSEMHLTTPQFQHPRVMEEWISTFEPSSDWFRLGIWYELDHDDLSTENVKDTVLDHVRTLYTIYETFLWTSDNNFRDFFLGASTR